MKMSSTDEEYNFEDMTFDEVMEEIDIFPPGSKCEGVLVNMMNALADAYKEKNGGNLPENFNTNSMKEIREQMGASRYITLNIETKDVLTVLQGFVSILVSLDTVSSFYEQLCSHYFHIATEEVSGILSAVEPANLCDVLTGVSEFARANDNASEFGPDIPIELMDVN
jgi:hypothetical protein